MLKDGQLFCDSCQVRITKISEAPAEGWPGLHALCSACFAELKGRAVPR